MSYTRLHGEGEGVAQERIIARRMDEVTEALSSLSNIFTQSLRSYDPSYIIALEYRRSPPRPWRFSRKLRVYMCSYYPQGLCAKARGCCVDESFTLAADGFVTVGSACLRAHLFLAAYLRAATFALRTMRRALRSHVTHDRLICHHILTSVTKGGDVLRASLGRGDLVEGVQSKLRVLLEVLHGD